MYTNYSACSLGVSYPALKCSINSSNSNSHDIKVELDGHKYSNMRSYIGGYAVSDRICIIHEL